MMFRNTSNSYGAVAKLLHWSSFLLILLMYKLGWTAEAMSLSPQKIALIGWHKSVGITVLTIILLRLLWKVTNPSPALPAHMGRMQIMAAQGAHWLLYLLVLAMPLSGWMMSSAAGLRVSVFGWVTLPALIAPNRALAHTLREAHGVIAWVLLSVVTLHILAALFHHFYYKDTVLKRMLPCTSSNGQKP